MSEPDANDLAATPSPPPLPAAAHGQCGNCGKPLQGPYCYHCGQPVQGLVRHFSSIAGDFVDTVLNWDARLPRTLWPLFAKPAFLTREYFAGRRVRYVSPVRLFVTLAIVTFFIAQLMLSFGDDAIGFGNGSDTFEKVATPEEVVRQRDVALAKLAQARKESEGVPGVSARLREAENTIRNRADRRIAALQRKTTVGKSTDADRPSDRKHENKDDDEDDGKIRLSFDGRDWNAVSHPVDVPWLPAFANRALNTLAGRTQRNLDRMHDDPDEFKDAVLGAVPSTLFVLLPVFALMLKLLYVFKRRLYMEHLIVALHSHAFLCMALLLMLGAYALQDWLAPNAGVLRTLFGWLEATLWIWMPLYLLLMQKRIYAQGWWMTLLKYSVLGWCYFFLLTFGAVFTVMFSVIWG